MATDMGTKIQPMQGCTPIQMAGGPTGADVLDNQTKKDLKNIIRELEEAGETANWAREIEGLEGKAQQALNAIENLLGAANQMLGRC